MAGMAFEHESLPVKVESHGGQQRDGVVVEPIAYQSADRRTDAYLVRPAIEPDEAIPGVVYAHGGGGSADTFLDEAIELAGTGAVAILPRTVFDSTGDAAADLGFVEAAVALERIALDLLAQRADVDPERLGVVGHSWGATQAAILAGIEPRLAAVVVAATGPRYAEFAWSLHDRPAAERAAYLGVVGRADPVRHLAVEGRRTVLMQFGRLDRIPTADVQELWHVAAGDKELAEFECGHDLVHHEPARLSRLTFLHRTLRI
jgi:dienelactone hydrolase